MGMETAVGIASLLSAGASVATATKKPKMPNKVQEAKAPDGGLSDKDKRAKLLAQLAAGASKANASGVGGVARPQTGTVQLGL